MWSIIFVWKLAWKYPQMCNLLVRRPPLALSKCDRDCYRSRLWFLLSLDERCAVCVQLSIRLRNGSALVWITKAIFSFMFSLPWLKYGVSRCFQGMASVFLCTFLQMARFGVQGTIPMGSLEMALTPTEISQPGTSSSPKSSKKSKYQQLFGEVSLPFYVWNNPSCKFPIRTNPVKSKNQDWLQKLCSRGNSGLRPWVKLTLEIHGARG